MIQTTIVPAAGAVEELTFNTEGDAAYDVTLTQNCVFTFYTQAKIGAFQRIDLLVRPGGFTPTFSNAVYFPSGVTPSPNITAGSINHYVFTSSDGGLTILGELVGTGAGTVVVSSGGNSSSNIQAITFSFPTPSTQWVINHNLNTFPNVTLVDTAGDVFISAMQYTNANQVIVNLLNPVAGYAYLN